MDELDRLKTVKALNALIDAVDDQHMKNTLIVLSRLLYDHEQRLDELQAPADDEEEC